MEQATKPIEGITPDMIWNALIVLITIGTLYVLYGKVRDTYWSGKKKKQDERKLAGKDLTDEIADKVLEKLNPRLDKIEGKLTADKERLDGHEARLNEQERVYFRAAKDMEQVMDVLDGLLMHFISGNDTERLREVKSNLDRYKNGRWKADRQNT